MFHVYAIVADFEFPYCILNKNCNTTSDHASLSRTRKSDIQSHRLPRIHRAMEDLFGEVAAKTRTRAGPNYCQMGRRSELRERKTSRKARFVINQRCMCSLLFICDPCR